MRNPDAAIGVSSAPQRAAVARRASAVRVLMCEPTYFGVSYAINPWMAGNAGEVDPSRAWRQWHALRDAIERHAPVDVMEGVDGLPDLPFTANAGVVRDRVFVPSRFRHAERRGEERVFARWFEAQGYEVRELPRDIVCEGAGDVLDQAGEEFAWLGCGLRSERCAAGALSTLLDVEFVPLELVDPRFYHLDTCFCPLPGGRAMYWPAAFTASARREIEARIPRDRRIEIDEADACRFACNAVVLGDVVVANAMGDGLIARLAADGLDVECVDVGEFLRAGGGARCLTFKR